MGIDDGVPQVSVDAIDEQIADRVLHVLGLFVDFGPIEVEGFGQEELDQSMPANHAQGQRRAGRGDADSFVRRVGRQPTFAQRFEHAGDRARRNAQGAGQLAGGNGFALVRGADQVNRLDVVFDGQAGHGDIPAKGRSTRTTGDCTSLAVHCQPPVGVPR